MTELSLGGLPDTVVRDHGKGFNLVPKGFIRNSVKYNLCFNPGYDPPLLTRERKMQAHQEKEAWTQEGLNELQWLGLMVVQTKFTTIIEMNQATLGM